MRTFTRTLIGLGFVTIVLVSAFAIFSFSLARRSASEIEGTLSMVGITDDVSIYRNEYGIPHIVGSSDMDVFFGIGYAHAQDRLWQMDVTRRFGAGRMSEIFGRQTLEFDVFMRHIGLHHTAAQLLKTLNPDARAALENYANGVNAFIRSHKSALPFEFDALSYTPDDWTPTDCLLVARLMAWELNMSFWSDAAFGAIADKLGSEHALDLIPGALDNAPYVMDSVNAPKKKAALQTAPIEPSTSATATSSTLSVASATSTTSQRPHPSFNPAIGQMLSDVLHAGIQMREFFHQTGSALGSNSWAVRANAVDSLPRHSQHHTGKKPRGAILANDTHLTLLMPPRWYEAHLSSPGLNVLGFTIPGLPFVVIGRNDDIAWGVTNMMMDDCDFFIEKIDSTDTKRFVLPNGSTKAFRVVTDTIHVKVPLSQSITGVRDSLLDIRSTDRSAVISDVHPFEKPRQILNDSSKSAETTSKAFFGKYCLTYSWTGQQMSDEILAFYRLNKAKNWERFLRAVNGFAVPGLNFTYADRQNNIGIAPAGSTPNRLNTRLATGDNAANFPRNAWEARELWQGVHAPEELPRLVNPPRGYAVSANNQTARKLPFHVSSLWEAPSRAARITDMLAEYEYYSTFEAQLMQTDVASPYAQDLTPLIVNAVKPVFTKLDTTERSAYNLLAAWNGRMEKTSPEAAIFNAALERIVFNTFADELGETLYRQYCFITNIPTRKIYELLMLPIFKDSASQVSSNQASTVVPLNTYWFDDKTTSAIETRDDILLKSFRQAVKLLRNRLQSGYAAQWQYGQIHQLTIPHVFDGQKPLETIVNLGPFPVGGNATTINSAEWKFTEPFKPVIGASMRFVCDMQDSIAYLILPGGNGGQPLTRNYTDQIQLWLGGGLLPIPVSREPHPSFTKRLVLVAKEKEGK